MANKAKRRPTWKIDNAWQTHNESTHFLENYCVRVKGYWKLLKFSGVVSDRFKIVSKIQKTHPVKNKTPQPARKKSGNFNISA